MIGNQQEQQIIDLKDKLKSYDHFKWIKYVTYIKTLTKQKKNITYIILLFNFYHIVEEQ